jgi:CheY-like chemotaxis protein
VPLLREIKQAGEKAAALTRQLLAFSRKQVLQPVVLDLNSLVADLEKMLRRLIGEDIDLACVLDPDLGHIRADPGQMEQVLVNLVVNSRDAMPTGGKVTIETNNVKLDATYTRLHPEITPGKYVTLAVTDTGCGMDESVKARIFEPFFTTKEPGKGTGLGLATVYGIVKQSGGSISVYSEPNKGTTFKIYLPRIEETASLAAASSLLVPPKGKETLLLAEDEEGVRALARHALQALGYTVVEATNGREALELCKQYAGVLHLLITDVVMPLMGGRELAQQARAVRPHLKVLYISGYTDDAIVRHGVLEAGMPFLSKPFTPAILAAKIREILDQVE